MTTSPLRIVTSPMPVVAAIPTRPRLVTRATLGTEALIASAVLAYVQEHGIAPRVVEMSALRLLSIPSSRWQRYAVPGLATVGVGLLELRCWQAPQWITGYDVDTMICLS